MEADKVDKFLLANESKFPEYEIPIHRLLDLPPEKEAVLVKTVSKAQATCCLFLFSLDTSGWTVS